MIPSVFAGSGEIRFETRNYSTDDETNTIDDQNALFVEFNSEESWNKINFIARQDSVDSSRNFVKATDLFIYKDLHQLSIRLGHQVLNIGNLEMFHGGDIFNARNFDSSPERFEKFGELGTYLHWSNDELEIIVSSLFKLEDPLLPSSANRSGPLINFSEPEYLVDNNNINETPLNNPLLFLSRYRSSFIDIELSLTKIPDRTIPLLVVDENFIPATTFLEVEQLGLGFTKSISDYLFKFEYFSKNYADVYYESTAGINPITFSPILETLSLKDHQILAMGFEYQKNYQNDHMGTFLVEYQKLEGLKKEDRKMYMPLQNDLGLGYRHSFNDLNSQEITWIVFIDQDTANEFLNQINYQRRFSDNWKFLIGLRNIEAPKKDDNPLNRENYVGLKGIRDGDHLYTSLSYNF